MIKQLKAIGLASAICFAMPGYAADPGIDRAELIKTLQSRSGISAQEAEQVVAAVAQQLQTQPNEKLPIVGVLYTRGMNFAFFTDSDHWSMDVSFTNANGNLVEIPKLVEAYFENGGLKAEFAYKWMFTFVPSGTTLHSLNGAIYGRGVGATLESFLGLEGAWMPGENRAGSLFHVAIKLGFGAGLQIPRITFRLREVSP